MKGDIIKEVETRVYVQGKKRRKLIKHYREWIVNDVPRVTLGVW